MDKHSLFAAMAALIFAGAVLRPAQAEGFYVSSELVDFVAQRATLIG